MTNSVYYGVLVLIVACVSFIVARALYKGKPKGELPPIGAIFNIECVALDNSFLATYLGKTIFFKGYSGLKKGYYEVVVPGDEKLTGSKTKMLKRINEIGERVQERPDTNQRPKETR